MSATVFNRKDCSCVFLQYTVHLSGPLILNTTDPQTFIPVKISMRVNTLQYQFGNEAQLRLIIPS